MIEIIKTLPETSNFTREALEHFPLEKSQEIVWKNLSKAQTKNLQTSLRKF
ncbi:MAG: hypothetical protein JW769_01880 [Parachlamydiales bacterium]|nr:hypothetical protein [Parachlamydiales bacterium]